MNQPNASVIMEPIIEEKGYFDNLPENLRNTDYGNAMRLLDKFGGRVRWYETEKAWYYWNEDIGWSTENRTTMEGCANTIQGFAEKVVRDLTIEAEMSGKNEDINWAKKSASRAKMNAMIEQAKGHILMKKDDFDQDPWLLNVQNGVIDLRTGVFRERQKSDLLLKRADVFYDPEAKCPIYDQFIDQIMGGNQELITYLDKVLGYCLTGVTSEQVFFIMAGGGANGKSRLINATRKLMGDYAKQTETKTFFVRGTDYISEGIASLNGARFVTAIETEKGKKLDEAVIKLITGEDRVRARFLHQNSFEFQPECKVFLITNYKPQIANNGHGIWRRIRVIPFEVTIPEAKQDKELGIKLERELSGILNRLIEGCLLWQKDGGLGLPEKVKETNEIYRVEADSVGTYLKDCCIIESKAKVPILVLYKHYEEWAKSAGEEVYKSRIFTDKLEEKGFRRASHHGTVRQWEGIRIKD
jgi:putative DNA primase/helicase